MVNRLWTNGRYLVVRDGKLVLCPDCPCGGTFDSSCQTCLNNTTPENFLLTLSGLAGCGCLDNATYLLTRFNPGVSFTWTFPPGGNPSEPCPGDPLRNFGISLNCLTTGFSLVIGTVLVAGGVNDWQVFSFYSASGIDCRSLAVTFTPFTDLTPGLTPAGCIPTSALLVPA